MPSRNITAMRNNKVPTKKIADKKQLKEKPIVKVSDKSKPEEILHSSWTFINVVQFFNTFHLYFNLKPFSIEKLEKALLIQGNDMERQEERESSVFSSTSSCTSNDNQSTMPTNLNKFLAEFLVQIIRPLVQKKKTGLNANTVNDYIWTLLPHYGQTNFNDRSILTKIKILKEIQDLHMEGTDEKLTALKNEQLPENLRVLPLGTDYEGWTYWYFGDTRLYREVPIPNGKKGTDMINTTDYTFQLLCSTEEEWNQVVKKFQPSNRTSSKQLSTAICDIGLEVIRKLEARAVAIERKESKLKRARELELVPKKRSRRLEVKFDEEAKRQKIMEDAKQKAALEEIERKEKKKREKMIAEQEKQELRTEEARLKNDVYNYITKLISTVSIEEASDLKSLRKQCSTTATENDRVFKMQQWIKLLNLNISVDQGDDIKFKGNDLDEAFNSLLFKNMLNSYLVTLIKFYIQPDTTIHHDLENIRKNLILNRYQSLNDFCSELNSTLQGFNSEQAIALLKSVFIIPQVEVVSMEATNLHTPSYVHSITTDKLEPATVDLSSETSNGANRAEL